MILKDLLMRLEELEEVVGSGAEVRLMTQDSYPLEAAVLGCCTMQDMRGDEEYDDEDESSCVAYIVEGDQIGYGKKRAWEVAE